MQDFPRGGGGLIPGKGDVEPKGVGSFRKNGPL